MGIVAGYPDGNFKPNANITRAEFVAMLVRALGLKAKPEAVVIRGRVLVPLNPAWPQVAVGLGYSIAGF